MAKFSKKNTGSLLLVKVFAICCVVVISLAAIIYYRNKSIANNQIRQEQLENQKEQQAKEDFIKEIAPIAQKVNKSSGVLPSITIAQACLESDFGTSQLSKQYNNLFGVKGTNPNTTKVLKTKEYVDDKWIVVDGRFQIYDSYEASITAHTRLFVNGTTWNANQYQDVLNSKDYKSQAKALSDDGYATDPDYVNKVINIIEEFKLYNYDN